ncbi:MAG TPA: hypothetical protein VMG59_06465 [Phycisphaerae bacterium]|nr:hypothetical protein [Phycisphaerae bacterium]
MGLDATVYCDCFEQGKLRTPPLPEWNMFVEEGGARSVRTGDLKKVLAFDQWNFNACEHERGILRHYRIGNIATVDLIRMTLTKRSELFPIILSKIVYNGIHCGDFINIDQITLLKPELQALSGFHSDDALAEGWIRQFETQLYELVEAAFRVKKPIVF